ncbi:MAG: hypothetical protein MJB14_19445 [Spirochaetes bacterium]|nr:hypothetical protein [Spirochaetota bacterium]
MWSSDNISVASVILANGKLIVLTENAHIYVVEANPEEYKELVVTKSIEARKHFWTAPVLCKGLLFVRNDRGTLLCIDLR